MADPEITREQTQSKGRYSLTQEGHEAELTYSRVGSSAIIIDHTGVPEALRGTGAGRRLVERAITDARTEGLKVIPLCPFAKAQIERTPEWQDVLQG
ncbi:GNAT family N-acetyltransferase [Marinovum sp.]|uniref:GNAT family N-acetyltransferase n=1 Tax=Marinovum sp. TaxID=2024839 RepID=UPI002B271F27|nr:GNAT family N-acetyltransferase [Marinovum sp.]